MTDTILTIALIAVVCGGLLTAVAVIAVLWVGGRKERED